MSAVGLHDGQALVADFGIALAATTAGGTRMTETGLSLGTPTYMSPEQATGERQLDARCDLYALGCVLYEMLAGGRPSPVRPPSRSSPRCSPNHQRRSSRDVRACRHTSRTPC
jgi:serine/threonine protein kinase